MAGESLNRPDESKLSSVRFLLSPMVVLRTPAPIKIGVPCGEISGCETPAQRFSTVGKCTHQLLPTSAWGRLQLSPRGTLIADQRRAGEARPKGKYSKGRIALAPIRTREFSLPRGAAGGQGHSQLKTSNFYIAHRFFVTFFTEESNVPLFPSPLRQKQRRGASSAGAANNV